MVGWNIRKDDQVHQTMFNENNWSSEIYLVYLKSWPIPGI